MHSRSCRNIVWSVLVLRLRVHGRSNANSCATLMDFKAPGVEITKAEPIA